MKRLVIAAALIAMVGTACSSESEEPADVTTTIAVGDAAGTTTSDGGSTSTSATPETTTTQAAATTTAGTASSGLDACVVGTWEMDSDKFFEDVFALAPPEGIEGEFAYVGGAYLLLIGSDGSFEARRDNWAFGVTSDFGELEIVINASQLGTYELDGDMLSTTVAPGEPPDIQIKVDGEPFTFPGGVSPIAPPEAEFSGATVVCDSNTLVATAEGFSSEWSRS